MVRGLLQCPVVFCPGLLLSGRRSSLPGPSKRQLPLRKKIENSFNIILISSAYSSKDNRPKPNICLLLLRLKPLKPLCVPPRSTKRLSSKRAFEWSLGWRISLPVLDRRRPHQPHRRRMARRLPKHAPRAETRARKVTPGHRGTQRSRSPKARRCWRSAPRSSRSRNGI